jgi:hypothetical protein
MKAKKFFLDYSKASFETREMNTVSLRGKEKEVFNQLIDSGDYMLFVLVSDFEQRLNFILFCAAANNEL